MSLADTRSAQVAWLFFTRLYMFLKIVFKVFVFYFSHHSAGLLHELFSHIYFSCSLSFFSLLSSLILSTSALDDRDGVIIKENGGLTRTARTLYTTPPGLTLFHQSVKILAGPYLLRDIPGYILMLCCFFHNYFKYR